MIDSDGGNLEDREVFATGSYNATAPINTPGVYTMALAAFELRARADENARGAGRGASARRRCSGAS